MALAAVTIVVLSLVFSIQASSVPGTPDRMAAEESIPELAPVESEVQRMSVAKRARFKFLLMSSSKGWQTKTTKGGNGRNLYLKTRAGPAGQESRFKATQKANKKKQRKEEEEFIQTPVYTIKDQADDLYQYFADELPACSTLFQNMTGEDDEDGGYQTPPGYGGSQYGDLQLGSLSQTREGEEPSDYKLFEWVDLNKNLRRAVSALQGIMLQLEKAESKLELDKMLSNSKIDTNHSICEKFEKGWSSMIPCDKGGGHVAHTPCDNQPIDTFDTCDLDRNCQFDFFDHDDLLFWDQRGKHDVKPLLNPEIVNLLKTTALQIDENPKNSASIFARSMRVVSEEISFLSIHLEEENEKFGEHTEGFKGFECTILREGKNLGWTCQRTTPNQTTICQMYQTELENERCFIDFDQGASEKTGFTGITFRFSSTMVKTSLAVAPHPMAKSMVCNNIANETSRECTTEKKSVCFEGEECNSEDAYEHLQRF